MVDFMLSRLTHPVYHANIEDFSCDESFNGVYASGSLHHLNQDDLIKSLDNIHSLLVKGGVVFAIFKYGLGSFTDESGRFFNLMTAAKMAGICNCELLRGKFELVNTWLDGDLLHRHNQWVSVMLRKL